MNVSKVLSVAQEMSDVEPRLTTTQYMEDLLADWVIDLREAVESPNESTGGTDFDMVAEGSPTDMENQIADVDARCDSLWQAFHELTDRIAALEQKKRYR